MDEKYTSPSKDVVLVLTTVPAGELGEGVARALVEERLAACVSVLAPMTSIYRWQGAVERGTEQQIVIKTTADRVAALQARLGQLHPYDVPECLVLAVGGGTATYLDWVRAGTS